MIELSHEALDDLVNIQNYTFTTFGEKQLLEYSLKLDKAFQFILSHPFGGYHRDDIPSTHLAFSISKHIVIYRIEEDLIYVVRVLHERMNFRNQL